MHVLRTEGDGLMLTIVGLSWMERAACKSDPDRQFPPWNAEAIAAAKAVCAGCSVRRECLQLALATRESEGVWGGLTPTERAKYAEGLYRTPTVPCPGCGRMRALTAEGVVRVHTAGFGNRCSGSGSKP